MKYCNRLADVGPAPGSPCSLPVHRLFKQEPRGTDEPAWLPSFFSLWFGDYTGRPLLRLQKKKKSPSQSGSDEATSPDVPVPKCTPGHVPGLGWARVLHHPRGFDSQGPSPPGQLSSCPPPPPRSPSAGREPGSSQLSSFKVNFPPCPDNH